MLLIQNTETLSTSLYDWLSLIVCEYPVSSIFRSLFTIQAVFLMYLLSVYSGVVEYSCAYISISPLDSSFS
ncbi:hypothetical protein BDB01DRAFT_787201 [Pilobolus umbonatus]|nr:hypothetical protein BDB01DRAFT_787201 [Pilobolus umbonatus]